MTGRTDFVRFAFHLHRNSQASSQGQLAYLQAVTAICEDCEAIFLKGLGKEIFIRIGHKTHKRHRGKRIGILSSQRSQAHEGGDVLAM